MASSQDDPEAPSQVYPEDTKEQCRFFYAMYEESIRMGTPHLILPKGLGDAMGGHAIEVAAWKLSQMIQAPVGVHFDPHYECYRIGSDDCMPFKPMWTDLYYVCHTDLEPVGSVEDILRSVSTLDDMDVDDLIAHASKYQARQQINSAPQMNSSSLTAAAPVQKIPKPPNCFILYRKQKQMEVLSDNPKLCVADVSVIVAEMWKHESKEVKAHYKLLAAQEKARHRAMYPNWKCSPRKSSTIRRRQSSTDSTAGQNDVPHVSVEETKRIRKEYKQRMRMRSNLFNNSQAAVNQMNQAVNN